MRMPIAEYAEHRGVEPNNIYKAILAGRILRNADGTIDAESADQMWEETTRPKIAVKTGPREPKQQPLPPLPRPTGATEPVPGMLYADARALTQVFEAQKRQLELKVRSGELISRAAVEKAAFLKYRMLRDACLNIPARMAPVLAAAKDETEIYHALEDEIRRVFQDFADGSVV